MRTLQCTHILVAVTSVRTRTWCNIAGHKTDYLETSSTKTIGMAAYYKRVKMQSRTSTRVTS